MDTSCYLTCFFTLENSNIILGALILSILIFLLYKKSKSYTLRLVALYLILGIFPFTTIVIGLTASCSHGFCVGDFFELISIGIIGSIAFLSIIYYFFGSRICLKVIGGKFLNEEDEPRVNKIFYELCAKMGVEARLAWIDSGKPIAMSISGSENVVILSVGALEILEEEEDELRAVLAHELAHLKLRDPLIKFISRLFGFSYVYNFIANKLEMEQEKRANEIAEKFSSREVLKNAILKFNNV